MLDIQSSKVSPGYVTSGVNVREQELLACLSVGSIYEHYKGKQYRVLGVGRHSEELTLYVYYEALHDAGEYGSFWIRPLAMFFETIEINGSMAPRFKKVG